MAPKPTKNRTPPPDPHGMFAGLVVFFVENGVQARRLQVSFSPSCNFVTSPTCLKFLLYMNLILLFVFLGTLKIWKQKLVQMGAEIEERLSKRVTNVFAMNSEALLKRVGTERLARFKGVSLSFCLSISALLNFASWFTTFMLHRLNESRSWLQV